MSLLSPNGANGTNLYDPTINVTEWVTSANGTMYAPVVLDAVGTIRNDAAAGNFIIAGLISGGALVKEGAGIVGLSTSTNTFTGPVTINEGTLQTLSSPTLNVGHVVTVASGATLDTLHATSLTISGANGAGTITNGASTGRTLTFGGTGTNTFTGNVTNSGGGTFNITKSGSGTQTLSGTNSYNGLTTISGGTLTVANIPNGGGITFSNSGTLNVTGTLNTSGTITAAGGNTIVEKITYTGAGETSGRILISTSGGAGSTFTIDQSGSGLLKFTGTFTRNASNTCGLVLAGSTAGTGEVSGVISNTLGTFLVTKQGTGTWTLSGTNTYTGATTVSAGVLCITGSLASGSAVSVAGGTLQGPTTTGASSTLAGTVAVTNSTASVINPGTFGNNTLNTGALTFSGTSARATFDSTATTFSKINVTGTCALGGMGCIFPDAMSTNGTYDLIVASGTMSGTLPSIITNSTGKTLVLSQVGNTLKVTVS